VIVAVDESCGGGGGSGCDGGGSCRGIDAAEATAATAAAIGGEESLMDRGGGVGINFRPGLNCRVSLVRRDDADAKPTASAADG